MSFYVPPLAPKKKRALPVTKPIVSKIATLTSVEKQNAAKMLVDDSKKRKAAPTDSNVSINIGVRKKIKTQKPIYVSPEEQNPTLPGEEEELKKKAVTRTQQKEPETVEKQASSPTVLVDTLEGCIEAMKEVMTYDVIAVDCEGVNLGRHGELCLVQVGLGEEKVFLFDVLVGGKAFFEEGGLRAMLEDPTKTKVLHDCRGDSDALYHQYGVALQKVFDTQVAFGVLKRQMAQPTPLPVSLNTLLRLYATPLLEVRAPLAKGPQKESAKLDFFDGKRLLPEKDLKEQEEEKSKGKEKEKEKETTVVEQNIQRRNAANVFKEQARKEMQENENYWKIRPMTPLMQGYASEDVLYLTLVYKQINALLHDQTRRLVQDLSQKYVAQVRDLEDVAEKRTFVDGVPKYGFTLWDNDTQMSINIQKNRPRRRRD